MEETQVKDETGTVKPMTRSELESEIAKKLHEQAAPLIDKIEDAGTRAKAENALKQLTAMMAMANMWVNAVISDIAATTVYTFQQTYDWKAFMEYQAAHNAEVANRIQAIQDMLNRVEHKVGTLIQEQRKLQPDHTKPPKVQ
jgi:hypothetical protein